MVLISRRNRSAALVSPVMSMSASEPVKMRATGDWVVAVIVTSAGASGGPAGWLVVVGGEVDGLNGGTEQMLGVSVLPALPGPSAISPRCSRCPQA
jgi:hypothetical protein